MELGEEELTTKELEFVGDLFNLIPLNLFA